MQFLPEDNAAQFQDHEPRKIGLSGILKMLAQKFMPGYFLCAMPPDSLRPVLNYIKGPLVRPPLIWESNLGIWIIHVLCALPRSRVLYGDQILPASFSCCSLNIHVFLQC